MPIHLSSSLLYMFISAVYLFLYYFGYAAEVQPYGGWIPIGFAALGLLHAVKPPQRSVYARHKLLRIAIGLFALGYGVFGFLCIIGTAEPNALLFWNGAVLVWLLPDWIARPARGSARDNRPRVAQPARWTAALFIAVLLLFSIPLPNMQALAVRPPVSYQPDGSAGKLLAPEIAKRQAYLLDWLRGEASRRLAADSEGMASVAETEFTEAELEVLSQFVALPYDVPDGFYTEVENADADPHALMKLLGNWNKLTGEDVTQGETVMGFGAVDAEGRIYAAGDIAAFARAAEMAKPDALIVPVEVFSEVKSRVPDLLVVPVTHFEEVLFVLDQPVAFWPISSSGLFCH
jgi:hypothetical protein